MSLSERAVGMCDREVKNRLKRRLRTRSQVTVMGFLVQIFDEGWLSIPNGPNFLFGDWLVALIFGLCRPRCIAIQAALPCAGRALRQEGLVSFEVPGHKN